MADREGAKNNGSTVTVGDFIFEGYKKKKYVWGLFGDSWKKDKEKFETEVLDLMAKHYAFYGKFKKEDMYVNKDSILCCDKGTHLTRFNMLKDHAVVDSDDTPIGICSDCKSDYNIYTFGSCASTSRDTNHKRTPVTAWNGKINMVGEKCIPMLEGSWQKETPEKDLKIWDDVAGAYCDVLTTGSYLVCYYGGIIKVTQVAAGEVGSRYIITAEMMKNFGWNISSSELKVLNDTLIHYKIKDTESVRLFMDTCAHESAKGTIALEMLNSNGTTVGNYQPTERGAGYIQLTWRKTHLDFLATIPDPFSGVYTATYIAQTYPWQAAAWFWSSAAAKGIGTPTVSLNEYAMKYGDSIGVYLNTQYAVNGWVGSPSNVILSDIRDGKKTFSVSNGRVLVNGADVGRAPNGWNDASNNYNREKTYNEAINSFP